MGLKEDMDKAVCMAGKMEFEYNLREVIRMITAYRLRKNELDARIKMLEETLIDNINNSALTVQRWRKTAVIGWCGN